MSTTALGPVPMPRARVLRPWDGIESPRRCDGTDDSIGLRRLGLRRCHASKIDAVVHHVPREAKILVVELNAILARAGAVVCMALHWR